ncbi:S24 family peptidase [uncultured Bifidobacterium sp.]|uniref:LexA family protein n=1 Tax=uncultured Bifidobacterium sp. TaxID=165187 RepID=UPI0028DCC518|nr:S24 family peptidase [uncultured Bifidobacterium sp.]
MPVRTLSPFVGTIEGRPDPLFRRAARVKGTTSSPPDGEDGGDAPRPSVLCRVTAIGRPGAGNPPVSRTLEAVHAGFPSVAQDYMVDDFSFDEHVMPHPETTFVVTVAGDSMQGAGIWDGDLLIVDRSLNPEDGDVVIAALDGELTVKRLLATDAGPVLHAENPRYPDFRPSRLQELMIWGVVTGSYHPQKRVAHRRSEGDPPKGTLR